MLQIYKGGGKGKTTAAIGMGIRAVGAGKKVLMIQFLKSGNSSETSILDEIDNFKVKPAGREGFFLPSSEIDSRPELKKQGVKPFSEKDFKLAEKGLNFAKTEISNYDLIILDEGTLVLKYNLLPEDEFFSFVKKWKNDKEIVITGRNPPQPLLDIADLVTEMKEIKHYWQQGISFRKGFDL